MCPQSYSARALAHDVCTHTPFVKQGRSAVNAFPTVSHVVSTPPNTRTPSLRSRQLMHECRAPPRFSMAAAWHAHRLLRVDEYVTRTKIPLATMHAHSHPLLLIWHANHAHEFMMHKRRHTVQSTMNTSILHIRTLASDAHQIHKSRHV